MEMGKTILTKADLRRIAVDSVENFRALRRDESTSEFAVAVAMKAIEAYVETNGGKVIDSEWTDSPRALTEDEEYKIWSAGRLNGIKLHRQLTRSSLTAAMRAVDALLASA